MINSTRVYGPLRIQTIAHRGVGDSDPRHKKKNENRRSAILSGMISSDLGSHLAIQPLSDGTWIAWHGNILTTDGEMRSPSEVSMTDIDVHVRRNLLTLEDVVEHASQWEKMLYLEPKVLSFSLSEEVKHQLFLLFANTNTKIVAAYISARRDIVHWLYECGCTLKDSDEEYDVPIVGIIIDEHKLKASFAMFREESQRTAEALALRIGIAIQVMNPASDACIPIVFLDRQAALLGREVMQVLHSHAETTVVLTINSPTQLKRLASYGEDAPYAVVTDIGGARQFLMGRDYLTTHLEEIKP